MPPLLPGAIDDRKRSADAHTPATSLDRAAPRQPQRCGRSPASQPLDGSATGNRPTDSDRPALDKHPVGTAHRSRGAPLPDRFGSKPARASQRGGLHPAASRHRAVRAVGRLGLPLVAAAPTLPEHVFHAVHYAGRAANPGRSPTALLGARLYTRNRLVPFPGSGAEGPRLDRQGRLSVTLPTWLGIPGLRHTVGLPRWWHFSVN